MYNNLKQQAVTAATFTSNFKQQALEYLRQAVQEDNAGNYTKAFPMYMNALEYFRTYLRYEKNTEIKEAIAVRCKEYLRCAQEIHTILYAGGSRG